MSRQRLDAMTKDQLIRLVLQVESERDDWKRAAQFTNETVRILAERLPAKPRKAKR